MAVLLSGFFSSDILAYHSRIAVPSGPPNHPLTYSGYIRIDTNIDTLIVKSTYYDGSTVNMFVYKRSEDNLTDTVYRTSPYETRDGIVPGKFVDWPYRFCLRFNEKNQNLSCNELYINNEMAPTSHEDFYYDEEGRISKYIQNWHSPGETPPISVVQLKDYDFSTLQTTENGYIFENVLYEFDSQGRLTFSTMLDGRNEYATLEGKEYLIGANYFTYTDSSYTKFGRGRTSEWMLGVPDQWEETTYVFYDNGNEKSITTKGSPDGVNWYIFRQVEYEYIYSNDNEQVNTYAGGEVSNFCPEATNASVYAAFGAIKVLTKDAVAVQIFDFSGRMVKQQSIPQGESLINVSSKGLYFVKVGNESFKVLVR